jgi:putative transposase
MPWQECRKVDERLRFVARLPDGEKMAVLCREFDVSRQTGYKIYGRYPSWGAPKIREKIKRRRPGIALPAISAVCKSSMVLV